MIKKIVCCALLLVLSFAFLDCQQQGKPPHAQQQEVPVAEFYKSLCSQCHGDQGKGDGPAAYLLFPKPRDFTKGLYKIRTTKSGQVPTDNDIFNTISNGIPGTAMASYSYLPEKQLRDLVDYLKSLAVIETEEGEKFNVFELRGKPDEVRITKKPELTDSLLIKGKMVYKKMECFKCHGETGLGDGPVALDQRDEWSYPAPPANFTRGIFKGGANVEDIYMRFTTGLNGTPMPSFEQQLSDEERWALAYYTKSLAKPAEPLKYKSLENIIAYKVNNEITTNPEDPVWQKISSATLPLLSLWQRTKATDQITVRAIHNNKQIAFLVEWGDTTVNGAFLRHQDFSDAVAIQFALKDPPGHITMGSKGNSVNIWQWRLDWQMDTSKFFDMEDIYPGMAADDYIFDKTRYPKSVEKPGHLPVVGAQSHDKTFLSGWESENTLSIPNRSSAIQESNAEGFGTLKSQSVEKQNVYGKGSWGSGKWKVVFIRNLETNDSNDVKFAGGQKNYIAFAVWDGAMKDRDGQKSITYWQFVELQK